MSQLFIEKYKPQKLDDLILDSTIYTKIKQMIDNKKISNLIFTGDSGVGKTATIHCIINMLYGKEYLENVLELNAYDDRGITYVFTTISNFCRTVANYDPNGIQHKLLILDEANNLKSKTQKIINYMIEKYPKTQFIFTCNNSIDIIESIQSKCVTIKFNNVPEYLALNKFKFICNNENITFNDNSIKYLYDKCQQDIRKTINMLEFISKNTKEITIEKINEMYNLPSFEMINLLLQNIVNKNVVETIKIIDSFNKNGYYPTDILLYIIDYVKNKQIDNVLKNEQMKITIIEILAECSYIISTSSPTYLYVTSYILKCIDKL